jgi:glycosyl transferase family 25
MNYTYIIIIVIIILIILFYNWYKYKIEYYSDDKLKNIYFITLHRDNTRLSHVNNLIQQYNLTTNSTIIEATDGNKLKNNTKLLSKYFTPLAIKKMRSGAMGCALSHIKLWEYLLTTKLPYMIIFEDDVKFNKNTLSNLNEFLNDVNQDYDICQLLHHDSQKKKEN